MCLFIILKMSDSKNVDGGRVTPQFSGRRIVEPGARVEGRRRSFSNVRKVSAPTQVPAQRNVRGVSAPTQAPAQRNIRFRRNSLPNANQGSQETAGIVVPQAQSVRTRRGSLPVVAILPRTNVGHGMNFSRSAPIVVPKIKQIQRVMEAGEKAVSSQASLDKIGETIVQVQQASQSVAVLPSEQRSLIEMESRLRSAAQAKIRGEVFHSTVSDKEFKKQCEERNNEFHELCQARVRSRRDEDLKLSQERQQRLLELERLESQQREVHADFVRRVGTERCRKESIVSAFQKRINVLNQQQEVLAQQIRDNEEKSNRLTRQIRAFLKEFGYQRAVASDRNHIGYEDAREFISVSGLQAAQNRSNENELFRAQRAIQEAERQMKENRKQIAALEKQRDEAIQRNKSSLRKLTEVQDGINRSVRNRTAKIVKTGVVVHSGGR